MADTSGNDLAESLQNLFTSVSSMVKSELQVIFEKKKDPNFTDYNYPIVDLKSSLVD